MKKLTGLMSILLLAVILTACGSATKSFVIEQDGISVTTTYTHKGDTVTAQSTETTMSYEAVGIESKEEAESLDEELIEEFKDTNGVEMITNYKDKEATVTIKLDYTKISKEDFKKLTGEDFDGDLSKDVSLEETEKNMEKAGFKAK